MGGSHRIPNIGKTGERVVASSNLENGHESVLLHLVASSDTSIGLLAACHRLGARSPK
jgi:hypothetical protein